MLLFFTGYVSPCLEHKIVVGTENSCELFVSFVFLIFCSHYAFYDSEENVIEMKNQTYYKEDLFGLYTLDKGGKIQIYEVPGVYHTDWHHNVSVIKECILPWLD